MFIDLIEKSLTSGHEYQDTQWRSDTAVNVDSAKQADGHISIDIKMCSNDAKGNVEKKVNNLV